MITWLNNLRNRGVTAQVTALAAVVLVVFAAASPLVVRLNGSQGVSAAALAALLCFAGAAMALATGHWMRGPQNAMAALLVGMACRMGSVIIIGLAVYLRGGPLADAGFLYYVLVFYPVTLAIETVLSLPENRRKPVADRAASDAAV